MPKEETIWEYKKRAGCTCPIEPGMDWIALRDLGIGCGAGGVCRVLDRYRQQIMKTVTQEQRTAEDIRLAKELRIGRGVGM